MLFVLRNILVLFCVMPDFNALAQTTEKTPPDTLTVVLRENPKTVDGNRKTIRFRPARIADLPESLNETSGLASVNGQLWTINDGGNPAAIYQIDTASGRAIRTVVVRNAVNLDWEGLAQDDSSVYIGDFGNNAGNRKDLCILKITKEELLDTANDTVQAEQIRFSYPDQDSFAIQFNTNNFDCEAFVYHNDSLHLFSKDWADLQTRHYSLPVVPGSHKALLVGQFNADGLITDASINARGNIVLLGYKKTGGRSYSCFAWLLSGYKGPDVFSGNKRRIELGSALYVGQTEGIVLQNDNSGWISSESIRAGWFYEPARLFGFDFDNLY
jgi:hypothetical protein